MTDKDIFLRIIADTDQDYGDCERWWREASLTEKLTVWAAIQRHYDDPAMECMSRFAQLGFSEAVLKFEQRPTS